MEIYKRFRKGFRGKRILESSFYITHPIVIFTYFFGMFSFIFMYKNPIFNLTGLIFTLIICLIYTEWIKLRKMLKFIIIMSLFIILINPLTNHRGANILFYLFDNPITLEAIIFGVLNAAMIFTLLILILPFNTLIDSKRFLFLFSKLSPQIAFITNMSLRFTGTFSKRMTDIKDVQAVRGINFREGKNKIKTAGILLEALIVFCLEEGMIISEVLKSKEYGRRNRSSYTYYKFTLLDFILMVIMVLLLVISFIFAIFYKTGDYSVFTELNPFVFDLPLITAYLIMTGFMSIPLILELYSCAVQQ